MDEGKIFVSRVEEPQRAEELDFPPTPAFGRYKPFFPDDSVKHPAKANTILIEFLVKRYTKPGEVVLDPMCGTGSTCIIAALHGRHGIDVDIEERFINWCNEAKKRLEQTSTLTPKGKVHFICGDARKLSELLARHVEAIITSPPCGASHPAEDPGVKKYRKGGSTIDEYVRHFSEGNIQNLPYIDAIVTSPPYSDTHTVKRNSEEFWRRVHELGRRWGCKPPSGTEELPYESPQNINKLPYGSVDTIITSPPYLKCADRGGGVNLQREGDVKIGCSTVGRTVEHPEAIDNIAKYGSIDAIITSPPYEECMGKKHHSPRADQLMEEIGHTTVYSRNPQNIGNMRGETYLEAMLKVYNECFKVLKPGGYCIVIVKPFIREKKVVDLPYHTLLLLMKTGFQLEKVYKLKLKQQSFWRILYYKKHPDVSKIMHEYILVTRRPEEVGE